MKKFPAFSPRIRLRELTEKAWEYTPLLSLGDRVNGSHQWKLEGNFRILLTKRHTRFKSKKEKKRTFETGKKVNRLRSDSNPFPKRLIKTH